MRISTIIAFLAIPGLALAEEPVAAPVQPSVRQLDGTTFQVGEVTFDKKSREIRFPTRVNMTEGLLEFLVVHENGKIHEALLATKISPTDLNLAFTLLRYPPSRELYRVPTHTGEEPVAEPKVPAAVRAAARVAIEVEWREGERTRRVPVNEWIQHEVTASAMAAGPWVYGGSNFEGGKYMPEVTGDVAAIFLSNAAILNYPGDDNFNDDVWTPYPKRVPTEGTPVTVIIAPNQKSKP